MEKPPRETWVPFGFAFLAAVICIVVYLFPGSDSARQGAFNIALTLAGVAGGAYAHSVSNKPPLYPPADPPASKE